MPQYAQKRLYYLDWLRMLSILMVFLVHVSMPYQTVPGVWLIQDEQTHVLFTLNAAFFYQWIMHLFFFLAGAGARFALVSRSWREYLGERFLRLFPPLIIGSVAFSPLQRYFALKSTGQFHDTFPQFFPHWWTYCSHSSSALLVKYGCYTEHLWFLGVLLAYSVISLPLFIEFQQSIGKRFQAWLTSIVELPAGLLLYILPISLLQATLKAYFPEHHNFSDFSVWWVYFIYGYVLIGNQRFMEIVEKARWTALFVGLLSFSTMMSLLSVGGYADSWELNPIFSPGYAIYQVLRSLNSWAWVVFTLGMAYRHLNFANQILHYGSEAVLPFYILHHVAVILIGYAFLGWHPPLPFKFVALSTSVLLITLSFYEYLVKRSNVLRLIFGMRL